MRRVEVSTLFVLNFLVVRLIQVSAVFKLNIPCSFVIRIVKVSADLKLMDSLVVRIIKISALFELNFTCSLVDRILEAGTLFELNLPGSHVRIVEVSGTHIFSLSNHTHTP